MKLKIMLAAGIVALTVGAMAAVGGTQTLPSQLWSAPAGNVLVNFTVGVTWDYSGSLPKAAAMSPMFRIDTNKVDLQFNVIDPNTGDPSVKLLSSITQANFALATNGWVSAGAGLGGSAGGTVVNLGGGVYDVQFIMSAGSTRTYTKPVANIMLDGAGEVIQAVVKTNVIAALPGGAYSIVGDLAAGQADVYVGVPLTHYQLNQSGGTFTVLPEPSAIIALVTGIGGLLALRRKA
jgi:hypothetical protein